MEKICSVKTTNHLQKTQETLKEISLKMSDDLIISYFYPSLFVCMYATSGGCTQNVALY